jgi:lysozyme family protein
MADFLPAFEKMIRAEGGYVLHKVSGDTGGQTYAGIARNKNPQWQGWHAIDAGQLPDASLVRAFYKPLYWDAVRGDELPQTIAESIFDFGVNAGTSVAKKLAQIVVNQTPDGVFGDKTMAALRDADEQTFKQLYALAKIKRYLDICNRDPVQVKFMRGWLNRTFKGLA